MNQATASQTEANQGLASERKECSVELTLEELLPLARSLNREGRLDAALQCCEGYLRRARHRAPCHRDPASGRQDRWSGPTRGWVDCAF